MEDSPRKQAIALLATYDKPDADAYERHVARLTHRWLRLMRPGRTVQGQVNAIMHEFDATPSDDYGCGWQDLVTKFTAWAVIHGWLHPDGSIPDR